MTLMNDIKILLCDHSFHTEGFRQSYQSGLDIYILRLQTEGRCQVLINGRFEIIHPGELLLFRPGEVYELQTLEQEGAGPEPSGDYFVMCTGTWIDAWWARIQRPRRTRIVEDERLKAIWYQLILEKRRLDNHPELLSTLLQSLCYIIDRAVQETSSSPSAPSFDALRMKYYIEEHATKPLRLEDVARHAGLSVSRTVALFKSAFGLSVLQYAQKVRLSIAVELMDNSSMTLEQIAEASGFGSYSYFHRIFKEHYGMPPGQYHKNKAHRNVNDPVR